VARSIQASRLDAAPAFGVMGIPTTYLIDKQGRIVRQAVGGREYSTPAVRQLIEALMR
jgi:hypothetical protein